MDPKTIKISKHAIKRYRERSWERLSDKEISQIIRNSLYSASEVLIRPEFRVVALISHKFKEAEYFKNEDFVFVVEDNILKTVHKGTANRWKDKNE